MFLHKNSGNILCSSYRLSYLLAFNINLLLNKIYSIHLTLFLKVFSMPALFEVKIFKVVVNNNFLENFPIYKFHLKFIQIISNSYMSLIIHSVYQLHSLLEIVIFILKMPEGTKKKHII